MTEYSFKDDRRSISTVLISLSKNRHLSSWEKQFVKDIKEYHDDGGFLSDKQLQKLSDLWEKY